jgi:hypothetical protein
MKQRYVRPDDDLDDGDELILRGGELNPSILRRDAQRMFDIYGTYGISVFALRGATIDELAQEAPLVRFPHFTVMTVRTIRVLGLRLEPTGRNHRHYTLMLRSLDKDVAALVSADHHVCMNPYHEA